ncbi:MAG: hypothetical protein ACXV8Q_16310 [Methylobacter sp.]
MIKHCPSCQSERLIILDFAKKSEEVIGMGGAAIDMPTDAKLDERIDVSIFDNCQCLDCGYEFNCKRADLKQRLDNKLENLSK